MNILDYRRVTDPLVKPESFKANWPIALHVVAHLSLIFGSGLWVAANLHWLPWWGLGLLGLLTGHSVACLGFAGHEIGHGALSRNRYLMYVWEQVAWTFTGFICVSIHRKAHLLHHVYTNGNKDPNSRPELAEVQADGPFAAGLSEWLFPNAKHPRVSALAGLWIVNFAYQMKLLFHSLLQNGSRYDVKVPRGQAWMGVAETFLWNMGWYALLWAAAGFSWPMFAYLFWMNYVGTVIGLAYICTNHLLNPSFVDHVDPLELTLSVRVPKWMDFLHLRFSHHNEHHLYPHAGTANYPVVREALLATFPERYRELGFVDAYRLICATPLTATGHDRRADVRGENEVGSYFPVLNDYGAKGAVASVAGQGPGDAEKPAGAPLPTPA